MPFTCKWWRQLVDRSPANGGGSWLPDHLQVVEVDGRPFTCKWWRQLVCRSPASGEGSWFDVHLPVVEAVLGTCKW